MEHKTVTIDFNKKDQLQVVSTKSIDTKPSYFLGVRRSFKYTFYELSISYNKFDLPKSIILDDTQELFKIQFISPNYKDLKCSSVVRDILINNEASVPYNILFNPNGVKDCNDIELKDFVIKCYIVGKQYEKGEAVKVPLSVTVNMYKSTRNYTQKFRPVNESQEITYPGHSTIIGYLDIENKGLYNYAEPIDLEMMISYGDFTDKEVIHWGGLNEIEESNPEIQMAAGIRAINDTIESTLIKRIEENRGGIKELKLKNISAGNKVSVPVYCNFARLQNPVEPFRNIEFSISTKNNSNSRTDSSNYSFKLLQDTKRTQLNVAIKKDNFNVIFKNREYKKVGKYTWTPNAGGTMNMFSLEISNLASSHNANFPNAALYISNIVIDIQTKDETGHYIVPMLKDSLKYNGDTCDVTIKNGDDSKPFYFYFNNNDIIDIVGYEVDVNIHISFNYFEDKDGSFVLGEDNMKSFSFDIGFVVEQNPGDNWLAVDFGTSATVAAIGGGNNVSVLDLHSTYLDAVRKNENGYQADDELDRDGRVVISRTKLFEENTRFLSSNIILNNRGNTDSIEIDVADNVVWLSPSLNRYKRSTGHAIPYIKSLVGHKMLPNIKNYNDINYSRNGEVVNFATNPLTVDEIFRMTYKRLFNDYVCPALGDNITHRMILTFPNTYTPRHIDYIRCLAEQLPFVRKNHLQFISESDSVACYYLSNWDVINRGLSNVVEYSNGFTPNNTPSKEEFIIVYDMGAGTLDLTYFSIHTKNNGYVDIEILAKIGINKAGNYLDYQIAKAVLEVLELGENHKLLIPITQGEKTESAEFKEFVRNNIKPNIGRPIQIPISINGHEYNIDCLALRNNQYIESFIKECTSELLSKFFTTNGYRERGVKIDTILFTGRSVQFADLKNQVQSEIQNWDNNRELNVFAITENSLKSIVAEGALYFASRFAKVGSKVKINNKNIYASYGILFKNLIGRTQYIELLTPNTKPVAVPDNSLAFPKGGITIREYDTDRFRSDDMENSPVCVDLSECSIAYFVQSYSEDSAQDWDDGKKEYISEICSFNPENDCGVADLGRVHLRVVVNSKNEMIFHAGNFEFAPQDALTISSEGNEVFNKSMWPYIV